MPVRLDLRRRYVGTAITLVLACIVAGQITASLIVDHYGWLGFPVHAASWGRIFGCLMLVGGVVLIRKF